MLSFKKKKKQSKLDLQQIDSIINYLTLVKDDLTPDDILDLSEVIVKISSRL